MRLISRSSSGTFPFLRQAVGSMALPQRTLGGLPKSCRTQQATRRRILDWLRVEYEVEKATLKLQSPFETDCDGFVAEVRKVRGEKKPLSAAVLANLREEYARSIDPTRAFAAEALNLESEVSDLVNEAYSLTPKRSP